MNARQRQSNPLVRAETDLASVFQFLQLNGYPFFWSIEDLSECIVVQVMDIEGELLGYVWGRWVNTGVLQFHVCSKRGTRLPFLSSDLLHQLFSIAFLIGADDVVTTLSGGLKPIRRLLQRLGFDQKPCGEGASEFTLNLWTYYGRKTI